VKQRGWKCARRSWSRNAWTASFKVEHVYAIDWDHPEDNIFIAVNQLPISGGNNRRPDILIYVNGLPLVLFELKNPYSIAPSEEEALNQMCSASCCSSTM